MREADPERTSGADAAIIERRLAEIEPLDEISEDRRAALETDRPADRVSAELESLVDARISRIGS